MSRVGESERKTQKRVIAYLRDTLGYRYVGDRSQRVGNANVEAETLRVFLQGRGVEPGTATRAIAALTKAASVGGSRTLYTANREVHGLLRYGVPLAEETGGPPRSVPFIDWRNPDANLFDVAEEVTVVGGPNADTKRPDVVLYVNGIALGVLELKKSTKSVAQGIRQNLDSQDVKFIRPFFSTVQLVMAGNASEGLKYAAIEAPEKHWLTWQPDEGLDAAVGVTPETPKLLAGLARVAEPARLLKLVHDFVAFDAGTKKLARYNQFRAVQAAGAFAKNREGGVVWHTQGSGKSLTMVWLAQWIKENIDDARVLVVTDRDELDKQIEGVFAGAGEEIHRTSGGAELLRVLNQRHPWLVCSLVHKFGVAAGQDDEGRERDVAAFVADVKAGLPEGFAPKGRLFVFVDECHRTQSGLLHDAMNAVLPDATTIGFTGTPLLKRDKKTSVERFGRYIDTYHYDQAVRDEVVLDLRYEARDIEQDLTSTEKIDQWFQSATLALTGAARERLKQRWGTMRKLRSSKDRLQKIAGDVSMEFQLDPRLSSGRGNAMIVCDSIHAACRLYQMFQEGPLAGKVAVVTSYEPTAASIKGESSGAGNTEKLLQHAVYRKMLAAHFGESEDKAAGKAGVFEDEVKARFVKEPGQMQLLIVVDKLLTGFDAPPASVLFIDKKMRDHGLFQAICRVNRLDGADKEYGRIVDYMDLFDSLKGAMSDYTGGAFEGFDEEDVKGLLKDRVEKGKTALEEALEAVLALTDPVDPPKHEGDYVRCFCGEGTEVQERAPLRAQLYASAGSLTRAFAAVAGDLEKAGYTVDDAERLRERVRHFADAASAVELASGDGVDLKQFEPAMRHLLDQYVRAEEAVKVSEFKNRGLVELLAEIGVDAEQVLPEGMQDDDEAKALAIENNLARAISEKTAANPAYYQKMSELLEDLILQRKKAALEYKARLRAYAELAAQVTGGPAEGDYPRALRTDSSRAVYDLLNKDEDAAQRVDAAVRAAAQDGWRGHKLKEKAMIRAIEAEIEVDATMAKRVLGIFSEQGDL